MSDQVSIIDIIAQSRQAVLQVLSEQLGVDEDQLAQISEIVNVMQAIPPQLVNEIAIPTIVAFAASRGLQPNDPIFFDVLARFDRIIASNINTATSIIIQQLREQQVREAQSRQRLSSGLLAANG